MKVLRGVDNQHSQMTQEMSSLGGQSPVTADITAKEGTTLHPAEVQEQQVTSLQYRINNTGHHTFALKVTLH